MQQVLEKVKIQREKLSSIRCRYRERLNAGHCCNLQDAEVLWVAKEGHKKKKMSYIVNTLITMANIGKSVKEVSMVTFVTSERIQIYPQLEEMPKF